MTPTPWHVAEAIELERILPQMETEFPYLHLLVRDGHTVFAGEFPIVESGRVIDSFSIEVIVPPGGAHRALPSVRETGGRIPWLADRHVYSNGTACLFIEAEYWFRHPTGLDLVDFLRGPVRAYFVGQLFFEAQGRWPFGQRAHGAAGDVDFFSPLVGSRDPHVIRAFLRMVSAKKLRSTWRCPCGSRRRLWGCHDGIVRKLRGRIKRTAIVSSLHRLDHEISHAIRRAS